MTLAHWDDVAKHPQSRRGRSGTWSGLGTAAGAVGVGLNRIELAPGEVSTPAHAHLGDEEIFFVLGGSGLLWQDGATCEVRTGDAIVHRARGAAHTLRGGDGGLDVLAFGLRAAVGGAFLPRVGGYWLAAPDAWLDVNPGVNPFDREPNLDWPEPGERPRNVVNVDEVEGDFGGLWKRLAREAGATRSGLNWGHLPPHEEGAPPHCHSVEEEIYVVLAGEGTLELWGRPRPGAPFQSEPEETHPLRAGHVVSRPAGSGISACLRTGDAEMTYLAYGTRDPADACYYPRSNKVALRGLGLIARVEPLAYDDGEPG